MKILLLKYRCCRLIINHFKFNFLKQEKMLTVCSETRKINETRTMLLKKLAKGCQVSYSVTFPLSVFTRRLATSSSFSSPTKKKRKTVSHSCCIFFDNTLIRRYQERLPRIPEEHIRSEFRVSSTRGKAR